MSLKLPALLFLCLVSVEWAGSCAWDRDTLAVEADGLPEIMEVAVGRFPRWPNLYYQMRIDRLQPLLATTDDLNLFDDVGVALDRIGRSGEAIEVMALKLAHFGHQVDDPAFHDHYYRYLANSGTFHAHRWLRSENRQELGDLERAEKLLVSALRVNPDAHFGRERFQLGLISQLLVHHQSGTMIPANVWHGTDGENDGVEGLLGLIVLGEAWGSFDVFAGLADELRRSGRNQLAFFVWQRCKALQEAGKHSLLGRSFTDDGERFFKITRGDQKDTLNFYEEARLATVAWQEQRDAFIMARLRDGEHPDTHADFWQGYQESAFPKPPRIAKSFGPWYQKAMIKVLMFATMILIPLGLSFVIFLFRDWKSMFRTTGRQARSTFILDTYAGAFLIGLYLVLLEPKVSIQAPLGMVLVCLWPVILYAPAARRFQDLGLPAKKARFMALPLLNHLVMLRLIFQPGTEGANAFGDPPTPLPLIGKLGIGMLFLLIAMAGMAIFNE